ncbi:polysaccharide deacetylase family protein [Paenibacillus sp. DXFW5]|uniref:Polysaccharide deacetylase family protein n=1 Tax=Paenibacillus rhizolycopersici TaxID=2780073 RepID=A0ABS2H2W0_9BACL|nr:polysaccharide deacetylase family protein [Paenibacillus rhizolycopersici]
MLFLYLLMGLIGFMGLYMIIPSLLPRIMRIGVFRKGKTKNQVAFTFDDGPHPRYTPELLDLLQEYQVKATFFVLGSQAELYPDLIRRMHREGHQIGIHNYVHTSNWLMLPGTVRRDHIERTADIIESIIGKRPNHYRPPWGLMNLFDFFHPSYRIVLWSLKAWDWRSKSCRKQLRATLLNGITDGSVILLHDSGDTPGADRHAPYFMLRALKEVLHQLQGRNLQFVRLDEMA